jgi:hypothetical protein
MPRGGEQIAKAWPELAAGGLKVRTRALTTTLFARLFLADLFIHGIGGGKYDELNDAVMRRFYGVEPPRYLVLSATRWLPLPSFAVTPADRRRLAREVRDLHWNPQHYLDGDATARTLIESKRALIADEPRDDRGRRARFESIRTVTERLRSTVGDREAILRRQLELCDRQLQANAVLRRRDYSFCLYPEAVLRPFFTQFL